MPRIWVTQEKAADFSPAEQFGEVQFLTSDDLNNMPSSLHNEKVLGQIKHKLETQYMPEVDYLIIIGSPYVAAAVFMLLGTMGVRRVKLLRWSNQSGHYLPMEVKLPR
jgi:hypothetical protein